MKKNLLLRLCLMMTVMLSLYSCISDEITSQENPSETLNAARFSSKSLWEEDEKYISKVREVYAKNANENYIQQKYGTIYWDYATTMDQFDESYLMVPVLRNNKVINILEVFRVKNRVYFQFSADDLESNEFFQTLIFDRDIIKAAESSDGKDTFEKTGTINVSVCKKYTIIVGYVEGASGEQYPIENTKTICKFVEMALPASQCLGLEDPATGECMGAGSGGGESGYEYPEPPEEEDPCEKVKTLLENPQIQDSLTGFKNHAQTNTKKEKGFQELKSGTIQAGSTSAGNEIFFGIGINSKGTVHTHQPGTIGILAPQDIMTFLHIVRQQDANSLGNAYNGTVSDSGTYFIYFTGTISDLPSGMTEAQEEAYVRKLVRLYKTDYRLLLKEENKIPGQKLSNFGLEKLFFNLLDNIGLTGKITLLKEKDGNTSTIQKDSNGNPIPNPC
ncbi:hypothetical protein PGH12_10430 [Chryseobacterium wangxinyae]|uniref:hypothetical protein n=1 Tax=Chryseobacterium sp. CY350 TaxID=2997336 RepID=UPI00226ED7F7|nr:hypothetical protein [Chryseobacterium sp. CY350]MCY0978727.1 hypothetical protein [Chryseobacterium sp. CY350]WBZ93892.1 hypothetical protein PGH12_10430 [Chryseobacterium sp. CY350]